MELFCLAQSKNGIFSYWKYDKRWIAYNHFVVVVVWFLSNIIPSSYEWTTIFCAIDLSWNAFVATISLVLNDKTMSSALYLIKHAYSLHGSCIVSAWKQYTENLKQHQATMRNAFYKINQPDRAFSIYNSYTHFERVFRIQPMVAAYTLFDLLLLL